jgi:hypothetical protein
MTPGAKNEQQLCTYKIDWALMLACNRQQQVFGNSTHFYEQSFCSSKVDVDCWASNVDPPMMLVDRILLIHVDFEELVMIVALEVLVPAPRVSTD